MAIADPTTATILVFLMALLLLIQTVGLLIALGLFSSRIQIVEESLVGLVGVLRPELRETSALFGKVTWVREKLPALERQSLRLLDATSAHLTEADRIAAERLRTATSKIDEAGRRFEYGLTQFTRQTTHLTRELRRPTGQASALMKGILAGIGALKARDRSAPLQDEDIFI